MYKINVLILSAGRRVELIQCFKDAATALNIKSNIVAADCSNTAPALYFADKICSLPRIEDERYISSIIKVCRDEKISLIIPTIDIDLLTLSKNKEYIEKETDALLLVSDLNVVEICRNKHYTHDYLNSKGFGIPKSYSSYQYDNLQYPLIVKPADGSSSKNVYKVNDQNELNFYIKKIDNPIIQEFVIGDEYTVDVFLTFDSEIITVVPRLRIATRSGEILKGKIIKDRDIINDVIRLVNTLKPIGHITVQLMKSKNEIKYIEINPRFGGGAPMSIKSGADSCKHLYRLLMGEKLSYNEEYKDNITFLRFDNCVRLDENMELVK